MNILDIDTWSKTAVSEYLTKNVPLNDTITKIAETHGLNKDQISRIVEAANTDVYVNLFNQAKDKYIHYETADTEKIANRIFKVEKTSEVPFNDYQEPPVRNELEVPITESLFKTAEIEVNELPTTQSEGYHEYYKMAALESRLMERMDEIEVKYEQDSSILLAMVKQAVLGGTSFGDIAKALTSVYDSPVITTNIDEIKTKLAEEFNPRKLNEAITEIGTVNLDNPIVKQAGVLLKYAEEYKNLKSKHSEAKKKLVEHLKTSQILKKAIAVKPILQAGAVGVVGGGVATKYVMDKRKEQQLSGELMRQPSQRFAR